VDGNDLLSVVESEIYARLTAEPCETCGRGKDAEGVAATALAKISNDMRRLKMAEMKRETGEKEIHEMNPLALLATAKKLPSGNTTRLEMIELLDGQAKALTAGVRALRREESNDRSASGSSR
jgi:hypothetical protein